MRNPFSKNNKQLKMLIICLLAVTLLAAACGGTQSIETSKPVEYPSQPIKMLVTHGVGGGVDTSARGLQPFLDEVLETPIVVENKEGAGGLVALNYLATQKPDGYTILVASVPSSMMKQFLSPADAKFEYDDFVPLGAWNNEDTAPFLVSGKSSYETFEEFKNGMEGKKIKLGLSGGMGSSDHATYVLLKEATGLEFIPVPFDSASEAMTQLQGGHIDCALASVTSAATPVRDGQLRVLAIPSAERISVWPDVPTFIELGYKDIWMEFHVGAFAPQGTTDEIKEILSKAIVEAASGEEFKEWAGKAGIPVGEPMNSEQWSAYIQQEYSRMESLIDKLIANPLS